MGWTALVWVWLIIGCMDADETARWAQAEDVSRATANGDPAYRERLVH